MTFSLDLPRLSFLEKQTLSITEYSIRQGLATPPEKILELSSTFDLDLRNEGRYIDICSVTPAKRIGGRFDVSQCPR